MSAVMFPVSHPIFLLEFLLFDGAALAWAGYEIWSVRPTKDKAAEKKDAASEESSRHPEG
jgi:hypothetical protein